MRASSSFLAILLAASAQAQSGTVDPSTIKDCTFYTDNPSKSNPDQGSTCASIATYWGITEQQFISYNPSVGSTCSNIKTGYSYCVEENNGNGPKSTTTGTTKPTGTGAPTPTQSGLTKDCKNYYLVQSGDYCQAIVDKYGTFTLDNFYSWNPAVGNNCQGLQSGYYVCVGVASTPTKATTVASPTPTGPQPQQTGITKDCKNYYKVVSGDQCQSIVDKYGTFTLEQFYNWNPAVQQDCSKLLAGYYVCVGVSTTPTVKPTTTKATATGPTPTQTGIRKDCTKYYKAVSGDSCDAIANKFKTFTVAQFESWNPAVGSDCSKLFAGYYYCIAIPGTPTTPIKSATPTPTGKGPQPQQSGIVSNCNKYYKVASGDTCDTIEKSQKITATQFFNWNTGIKKDCSNLFLGYYVCTGVS